MIAVQDAIETSQIFPHGGASLAYHESGIVVPTNSIGRVSDHHRLAHLNNKLK
jgi:hypothetical protein